MSDTPQALVDPANPEVAAPRPDRKRWQIRLQTLLLVTAAIAVWMMAFLNDHTNRALWARIDATGPLANELIVDDPEQIAVVKLDYLWYFEHGWDIYLPDGQYRLCLATRGIALQGLAPVVSSKPISAGRHRVGLHAPLELDEKTRSVTADWDGKALLSVEAPWYSRDGSTWTEEHPFIWSEQKPAREPVVLFRRRITHLSGAGAAPLSEEPTDGILLWIERAPGP
jgi:hypothetical protein